MQVQVQGQAQTIVVSVQREDFDIAEQQNALLDQAAAGGHVVQAGALASFVGLVRADRAAPGNKSRGGTSLGKLTALDIEHYPAMTEASIRLLCEQALVKWQLIGCRVIHRVGTIPLGGQIVLVMVAAAHRKEAFAACEFIIDYLKTSAPFWKKAQFEHGEQWVAAQASDALKAAEWQV